MPKKIIFLIIEWNELKLQRQDYATKKASKYIWYHTPPHGRQHFLPIWMKNRCNRSGWSSSSFLLGEESSSGSSGGKCLWNASTAAATPSSFSSTFASSITRDFTWNTTVCSLIHFFLVLICIGYDSETKRKTLFICSKHYALGFVWFCNKESVFYS